MHLGLAAEAFDVGQEVALVGADGAAKRIVVGEGGAEAERKDGGVFETICDDTCMISSELAIERCHLFVRVFRDDNGEVTCGKEEGLIAKKARNPGEGHWTTVTAKLGKCLPFCNTVGVPCHGVFAPSNAQDF